MIKVGDRVKFLNDVGGGVVTGFISKNMVNVEGDDGFEVPYPINQLVNVSAPELNERGTVPQPAPEAKAATSAPVFVESEGEVINGKDAPEFYFCIVPSDVKNPLNGQIELFLVNDSNFKLLYTYSYLTEEGVECIGTGNVKSNSRVKVDSLTQDDLSTLPDFGFQLLCFRNNSSEWFPPVVKRFRLNPVRFYKASTFQPNSYFKRPAMVLKIAAQPSPDNLDTMTEADFRHLVAEKSSETTPAKPARKRTPDEVVIDLHINELIDDSTGLSKRELLELQKEKVESEMNTAIHEGVKRIVFIHGVGQGVLKQEVANLLNRKFKKYYFQDASFQEYGYGATMVILRK